MRCISCNTVLTDAESTRKNLDTGEYYDLCKECYDVYKTTLATLEDPIMVHIVEPED